MSHPLSPSPESQLTIRVHRMRVARGACWVIALALLGASGLTLLDAIVRLPGWVRGLGLAIWLTAFGVFAWYLVVRRWRSRWSRNAARAAQRELPDNIKAAAAAALLLIGSLLAALFIPNATEHIRRVAIPWYRPAVHQYRIVVTSKDPVIRSGDSVTLSAYVEILDPSAPTPETATVICSDRDGSESSIPMLGDQTGAFHATRQNIDEDFKYRIEVAGATSDWFTVIAIHPAEPTDQTTLEIFPPRYATGILPKQIAKGFAPIGGFQHGKVELALRFSRPTSKAFLEWRGEPGGIGEVIPIALSTDDLSGTATLQLKQSGTLRLVTVAEQNGNTLSASTSVKVNVVLDAPPRFERIKGVSTRPLAVRPGHTLPIELTAVDDVAVADAAIEYVVGKDESRPATLSIPLSGSNTSRADGRLEFDLPGKLREGEIVRYRIRIKDVLSNGLDLKPHEVVYPETGWAIVGVNPNASPIERQEIEGQRDAIHHELESAWKEVKSLLDETDDLKRVTRSGFKVDHKVRLDNARENQRIIVGNLQKIAQDAALTPELRSIAESIRDVADRPMKDAGENLRNAWTDNSTDSGTTFTAAIKHLTEARDRIDQLMVRNLKLAQARIDCDKIKALLVDQVALADRVKTESKTTAGEFAIDQQKLRAKLNQLFSESEPLRLAHDSAKQKAISDLAKQASDLATMLSELDTAIKQFETEIRKGLLEGIAADQRVVSENAAVLLAKIELASRLTSVSTPKPEDFRRAVDLITTGKTVEGLTELQRLSEALETAATSLEKWATDRANVKVATHLIALWQDDLHTRLSNATDGNDANFNRLPANIKATFHKEQVAILVAIRGIALPPNNDLAKERNDALMSVVKAGDCLAASGAGALIPMQSAAAILKRLAERIPTIPERLAKTRGELDKLQKEQESIQRSIEQLAGKFDALSAGTLPAFAKKLAPLAGRQQKQIAAFKALDIPGAESRRKRAIAALVAATADLELGLTYDVFASQAWVKREFDRMKLVVDELPPPEEKCDELARRLESVLDAIETIGQNPTKEQVATLAFYTNEMQGLYRQSLQFNQVVAPETPVLRNEAQDAIHAAEVGFRDSLKPDEVRRRLKVAIEATKKLSDRLWCAESDEECVFRLSWNRHEAAKSAKEVIGKGLNPTGSDVARGQLIREAEELLFIRVGAAGQIFKQRALDQYTKLKATAEPDHLAGLQNGLAETLDELAAVMADIAEFTTAFDRHTPTATITEADDYLPSKPLAESLRTLVQQQRALRERLNRLPEEILKRTQVLLPEGAVAKQTASTEELAKKANELADFLQNAANERISDDPLISVLGRAEQAMRKAAKQLNESKDKVIRGQRADAGKLREEAKSAIQEQALKIAKAAPVSSTTSNPAVNETAETLRQAEMAMRKAGKLLEANQDKLKAENVMRDTAANLLKSVANRIRSIE